LSAFRREILPVQADILAAVPIFVVLHHSLHERHNDMIDLALALPVKPV
jgi:hypothetical protein